MDIHPQPDAQLCITPNLNKPSIHKPIYIYVYIYRPYVLTVHMAWLNQARKGTDAHDRNLQQQM